MQLELVPVLGAGVAGGLVMFAVQLAFSAVRPREAFDAIALWSALLGFGERVLAAGFAIHLLVSIGVAAGYALGFAVAGVSDVGWAWGLVGSLIHWVAAGTFLAVVTGAPAHLAAGSPGAFGRRLGPTGAVSFLLGHAAFGMTAGIVYFALHSSGGIEAAF